jgi:hypothetical protein
MEAHKKRNIQSSERYTNLFPEATKVTSTIRKDANVYHTVAFIPKVVNETLQHTKQIAAILKANNTYDTCKNIWHFVYGHIAYKKDAEGYEQIRSPARAWHDRFTGVDCDCYSVFISSILTNLNIPHKLRITKYHRDYFQHIYPIVPIENGHITIDCVTEKFNYEVPFSEKKDYPMDLQYLNGFDGNPALYADPNDSYMLAGNGMDELGKIIQKRFAANNKRQAPAKGNSKKQTRVEKRKTVNVVGGRKLKGKLLNKVNKLNPATLALRNGILASMKLNIKNIAGRLRWSYLNPQEAAARSIEPTRFQKLIRTRQRLENLLYKAGGKPDNLRKAIMNGKGNKDKAVNGFEGLDGMVEYMNEHTPLDQLLGQEIHYSENIEGFEGLGELGEPFTLASIAAASGVIAGIAGMLKQVGDIFQKKGKGSQDFDEAKNEQAEKETVAPPPAEITAPALPMPTQETANLMQPDSYPQANAQTNTQMVRQNPLPIVTENTMPTVYDNPPANKAMPKENEVMNTENTLVKTGGEKIVDDDPPKGFWDKNKTWLKPTAIGIGGLTILVLGIKMLGNNKTTTPNKASPKALHGIPKNKQHHRKPKAKGKANPKKKTAVALM